MSHLQNPQGLRLTLAEQYILEAFPQSWLHTVEASELPIEDYTTDEEVE